jgi:hypothetical protein
MITLLHQEREVWVEEDKMEEDQFDIGKYFALHDVNGDGEWSREVRSTCPYSQNWRLNVKRMEQRGQEHIFLVATLEVKCLEDEALRSGTQEHVSSVKNSWLNSRRAHLRTQDVTYYT